METLRPFPMPHHFGTVFSHEWHPAPYRFGHAAAERFVKATAGTNSWNHKLTAMGMT